MSKKVGKFIQIAAAEMKEYVLLYALDDMGTVWLFTEDKDGRYWDRLNDSREQPAGKDN